MVAKTKALLVGGTLAFGIGCGPTINEMRIGYAPPLPEDCKIEVVNIPATGLGPDSDYTQVGNLIVYDGYKVPDPFAPEILNKLRPRACRMGGQQITLSMSSTGGSGGSVSYMVLRKKSSGDGADAAPKPEAPGE
jgi:hypothetical protein